MELKDANERLQATDPTRSFIVQAPAGSGKTELLTQRYLRLLSTVSAPEQIVALTFTRKAASEMRERILLALTHANKGLAVNSAHQQLTNQYAKDALQRCKRLNWQLLQQPSRLKIVTIDALCQSLTHAIPLYEQQTPYAKISDDAKALYKRAVRACVDNALQNESLRPFIQLLLEHLDNRQDNLLNLLGNLLSSREQWLSLLFDARSQTKKICEQALERIEEHELQRFIESIPIDCRDELQSLSVQVASIEADPSSARFPLKEWHDVTQLNHVIAASLAALLLTKEEKLRKSFDNHVGLKRGACENSLYNDLKARSKILLESLESCPDFLKALLRVKKLPPPHYEASQWQVLQALLTLLPMLAAHLQLVFAESNEVDFTAISQQALLALGDEECPTDLGLYLDNAIHHLLIDEFQDTSIQQFHLLTKLIAGWLPDEGKTLFVVGDPMQSIYRFRQAEVGLFLKAKSQGIGAIRLIPLELCCNFRSTSTLVDWVNTQFKGIFPIADDMESGAISFHPSVANRATNSNADGVYAQQLGDKNLEAQAVVSQVIYELENHPNDNIAILVRSRNQLAKLIPLLRAQNIPFQGVEIEKLASLSHIADVWSITKALCLPANRLSWLALLRSPWCGINLADLHAIANYDKKQSIFFALSKLEEITSLSSDGRVRAQFIYHVMHNALASRFQQSLTDWIIGVLNQLHGEQILNAIQRADLEQFFVFLSRFSQEGQIADFDLCEEQFKKLYSERVTQSRLQIMTIHKSKGLEFDCVILPGLGSKPQQRDKPLLRWIKLPAHQQELLLLSPIYAAHQKKCLLYDYLGEIAAEKERYEQQRLLYVAVTRTKKRLYLFDGHDKITQNTFRELLSNQAFDAENNCEKVATEETPSLPILSRLPLQFYQQAPLVSAFQASLLSPQLPTTNTRLTGVIAHELLQWICDKHPEGFAELPWGMIANRLKGAGLTYEEQHQALERLKKQIKALFADPVGQWICKEQEAEHNEYELLVNENGRTVTRIIDRTFVEDDCRWIIDFKTGKDDLKTQQENQEQVNHYAKLLAGLNEAPIRCGLYYLATNQWVHWHYCEP